MDDQVAALSRGILSKLANSAFGNIAGPLVSSKLGDLLGIGGTDKLAAYLDKIEAQLAQMQSEIVALQASVNQILAGETAIEEKIADAELQQALENFTIAATTVREAFSTYTDIVGGLASTDSATQQEAATELYGLLDLENVQAIASAMTVVQEFFAPSLSEMKGLIDYQTDVMVGAAFAYASDSDNLVGQPPRYGPPWAVIPNCTYWQSRNILVGGRDAAANAAETVVLPTLAAFATLQAQGLTLLNTAWLNTMHEPQIAGQAKAIDRVLQAMVQWGAAVPPLVDAGVASNLQQLGKRVNDPWTDGMRWDFGNGDVTSDNRFGTDWLMWSTSQDPADPDASAPMIAYQPWKLVSVNRSLLHYGPSPPYSYTSTGVQAYDTVDLGTFALPPKISGFLSTVGAETPTPT